MGFTDATKQKPDTCPFCPAEPTPELVFDDVWKYGFKCENKDCHVRPSTGLYVSLAGALGAWNGRSYHAKPVVQEPFLWVNVVANGAKLSYSSKEQAVKDSKWNHTVEEAVPLYRRPVAAELPDDAAFKAFPDLRENEKLRFGTPFSPSNAGFRVRYGGEFQQTLCGLTTPSESELLCTVLNNYNALYEYAEKLTKAISK